MKAAARSFIKELRAAFVLSKCIKNVDVHPLAFE